MKLEGSHAYPVPVPSVIAMLQDKAATVDKYLQPIERFVCFLLDGAHLRNEVCLRLPSTGVTVIRANSSAASYELPRDVCRRGVRRKVTD